MHSDGMDLPVFGLRAGRAKKSMVRPLGVVNRPVH